jgi:hypothetical protein
LAFAAASKPAERTSEDDDRQHERHPESVDPSLVSVNVTEPAGLGRSERCPGAHEDLLASREHPAAWRAGAILSSDNATVKVQTDQT